MYVVDDTESGHNWDKKNLMTIMGRRGGYDLLQCTQCGMKGRRYQLGFVHIEEKYSKANAHLCPKAEAFVPPERIRITLFTGSGRQFANLTPGSEHDIVDPPPPYENDRKGVWVMGVGEPVKVLNNEFDKL